MKHFIFFKISCLVMLLGALTMPHSLSMNPHDTSIDEGSLGMQTPAPSSVHEDVSCLICTNPIAVCQRTGAERFRCQRSREYPNGHGPLMHYDCMDTLRHCPVCRAPRIRFFEDDLRAAALATDIGAMIRCLRNRPDNCDISCMRYGLGLTPLHIIAIAKRPTTLTIEMFAQYQSMMAQALLSAGVPLDAIDAFGNTALHLALTEINYHLALQFLQKGAKVNMLNNKQKSQAELVFSCLDPIHPLFADIIALLPDEPPKEK